MSEQKQPMRKGRRRQEHPEKELQDSIVSTSIPGTSSARKNWTRSLSPRRSFNNTAKVELVPAPSEDTVTKLAQTPHYESVTHHNSVVTPVLNSLKRWTKRSARSQSPRRTRELDETTLSPPKVRSSSQKRPIRINSAPVASSFEVQSQLDHHHQETSHPERNRKEEEKPKLALESIGLDLPAILSNKRMKLVVSSPPLPPPNQPSSLPLE
jgi:hypothetical protein